MTGVPTSRKCDACRQRKKKCDLLQPSCSRCLRLRIPCIGSGQFRYRFVNEPNEPPDKSYQLSWTKTAQFANGSVPLNLSNELVSIGHNLASLLQSTDIRYDFTMFGGFLTQIPQRLGHNQALDASAEALVHAFTSFRMRRDSLEMVTKYTKALNVLRTCLDDPDIVASPETLCAVFLMIICQSLTGDGLLTTHGEGLSHMLRVASLSMDFENDEFVKDLIYTLCVPVIIESIFNVNIELYPWLAKFSKDRDETIEYQSIRFSQLARLRDYVASPLLHEAEIRLSYERACNDIDKLQNLFSKLGSRTSPIVRAHIQTVYSVVLAYTILLNTIIIRFFERYEREFEESAILINDIISLAQDAFVVRPMGAAAMPTMLLAAWPNDPSKRPVIEHLIEEYENDFPVNHWRESVRWLDLSLTLSLPEQEARMELVKRKSSDACIVM